MRKKPDRASPWARILRRSLSRGLILNLVGAGVMSATGCAARVRNHPEPPVSPASLYVETRGQAGTPVILLHGLVGSGRYWDKALSYLQNDHRVIVPDLLGFGRSPKPKVGYTVEDHLTALHRTIKEQVGDDPVLLIGHSMGSLLAIEYALANPGHVRAVVLIGPPLFDSPKDARRKIASISPMTAAFAFRPFLAYLACHLHEGLGRLGRRLARWMNRKLPAAVAEDAAAHTWESFSGSLRHVVLGRYQSDRLPRLQGVPILILHGESDRLAETEELRSLANRVGAEFVALPGDHHLLLRDERPAMEAISSFLRMASVEAPVTEVASRIGGRDENRP